MFNIIREPSFDVSLQLIVDSFTRMSELDDAIDWALARYPKDIPGIVEIQENFFLWSTDEFSTKDIPTLNILYRVEEQLNRVTLIDIQESPARDMTEIKEALGI